MHRIVCTSVEKYRKKMAKKEGKNSKTLNYVGKYTSKCNCALEIEEEVNFLILFEPNVFYFLFEFNFLLIDNTIENEITKPNQNFVLKPAV